MTIITWTWLKKLIILFISSKIFNSIFQHLKNILERMFLLTILGSRHSAQSTVVRVLSSTRRRRVFGLTWDVYNAATRFKTLPFVTMLVDIVVIIDYFSWLFRIVRAGMYYLYEIDKSHKRDSTFQDQNYCTKEVLRTSQFWSVGAKLQSGNSQ